MELHVASIQEWEIISATVLSVPEPELKFHPVERAGRVERLARRGEYFPKRNSGNSLTDRELFDRAARALLGGLIDSDPFHPLDLDAPEQVDAIALHHSGELDGVQGSVLKGYGPTAHACLALVKFKDAERGSEFLARSADSVSTLGKPDSQRPDLRTNVALTYNGLRTLELQPFQLEQFPKEFREGMEARAGLLGDVASAHPDRWELPEHVAQSNSGRVSLSTVDAVVLLQLEANSNPNSEPDCEWSDQHPLFEHLKNAIPDGVDILHVQPLYRRVAWDSNRKAVVQGHFGFVDGISQPRPLDRNAVERDRVALGEMVLGYPNAHGEVKRYKNAWGHDDPEHDFFHDGTFLVIRKLEQHVEAFEKYLRENGDGNENLLAAKLMGRSQDGRIFDKDNDNLISAPRNEFDYAADPAGRGCPMRSHIRRANPRGKPRTTVDGHTLYPPRIARRGFSYGPTDKQEAGERGLMFLAYCASIADQFEVIQRWVNGGNSTGLLSAHNDVLMGNAEWNRTERERFTIHVNGILKELPRNDPFVSLKWGMYLFVPSKEGLKRIAKASKQAPDRALASAKIAPQGEEIIAQLNRLASIDENRAKQEWKKILEDILFVRHRAALWAAIRTRGGVLRTPYGVLVGSADHVRDVFTSEEHYSAREYWHRYRRIAGRCLLGDGSEASTDRGNADATGRKIREGGGSGPLRSRLHGTEPVHAGHQTGAGLPSCEGRRLANISTKKVQKSARRGSSI